MAGITQVGHFTFFLQLTLPLWKLIMIVFYNGTKCSIWRNSSACSDCFNVTRAIWTCTKVRGEDTDVKIRCTAWRMICCKSFVTLTYTSRVLDVFIFWYMFNILHAIICLKKWKKVSSCFCTLLCAWSLFSPSVPCTSVLQLGFTWIYIEKPIKTRLRWIKENTLLNRQCNHTITSKRHWGADIAFIYNLSIRWQCWSMWSFVLRFAVLWALFRAADTMCTFVHLYQYVLGRNTIHRHSPNKMPEIL